MQNTEIVPAAPELVFVGIDTGLASLGIVSSKCEGGTWVPAGTGVKRLVDVQAIVRKACLQLGAVAAVAVEGYSYGSQFNAHQMGEAGAAIRLVLTEMNVKYYEVQPTLVKKFCSGKANTKKDEMRLAAFRRWGVDLQTEHDVDAFVLSKIAEALFSVDNNLQQGELTAAQKEVVTKCLSPAPKSKLSPQSKLRSYRPARKDQNSGSTEATSTAVSGPSERPDSPT